MRKAGLAVILLVSLLLGVICGQLNYDLFLKNMPPLAMSSLNEATARFSFLLYGLGFGLVIALWTAFAVWISRMLPAAPAGKAKQTGRSDAGITA